MTDFEWEQLLHNSPSKAYETLINRSKLKQKIPFKYVPFHNVGRMYYMKRVSLVIKSTEMKEMKE